MNTQQKAIPKSQAPALEVKLLNGDTWSLKKQNPDFAKKNFQDNLFYNLELSYTPKEIASKLKVYLKSILICKTKLNLNKFVCLSDDQSHLLYFAH